MRVWFLMIGLVGAAAIAPANAQQNPLQRAAWLAGCWEQRAPGQSTMEMWMPALGDLMVGGSRTVAGGGARAFEHLRIRARGDTLVYTAIPSGQRETDFRSTEVTSTSLVFENPTHDFPRRIIYRRSGADSLIARVEGPGPNGTTRGFTIPMRRASCTEAAPVPPAPAPVDSLVMDAERSPDGRQFLVVKGLGSNWDVYLIDPSGATRRLTDHTAVDYMPAWSPDGQRIAFVSARDGHQEIYTMRPDGTGLTQLTRGTAHNADPAWSPDGRSIAFRSERDGRPHIHVMSADGTGQRALTRDSAGGAAPAWSRDGAKIAFSSTRSGKGEVYIMNADGSGQTAITTTPQGHSGAPAWSPDGRQLAFWSSRDGNDEVYLMNADGTSVRNLTQNPARDFVLGWSADGAFIIFRSTRDRALNELYQIRPDGTGLTRLTTTPSS